MGQAVALLVGMVTGAYSSIFVASPLLGVLKRHDPTWKSKANLPRATGEALRAMVVSGTVPSRRRGTAGDPGDADRAAGALVGAKTDGATAGKPGPSAGSQGAVALRPEDVLQHKPRPRKKSRR